MECGEYVKSFSKTILFFLSFYKDVENLVSSPDYHNQEHMQAQVQKLIKNYALSTLDFDIDEIDLKQNEFYRLSQYHKSSFQEAASFYKYAMTNRCEMERPIFDKMQTELK